MARLYPQPFVAVLPCVPKGRQGLSLPAGPVQREHAQPANVLVCGVLADQGLKIMQNLGRGAGRENPDGGFSPLRPHEGEPRL